MKQRLTRKDFDLVRFPNGEIKLILNKTLTGEIQWKYGGEFNNGKFKLSPSEELVILMHLNRIVVKHTKAMAEYDLSGPVEIGGEYVYTKINSQKVYADFLPFKRQDKDKLLGEVKFNDIYSGLIALEFHEVAPHDSDTFAEYALSLYKNESEDYKYIVFPDCGAQKRFKNFDVQKSMINAKEYYDDMDAVIGQYQTIITFNKSRNANTGQLEFEKFETKLDGTAVIFDDICAFGGTFKHVAKELKKNGATFVKLVVNHIDKDHNGKALYNAKEMKEAGIDEIVVLNGGF